jgi:hypothetical protein
MHNYCSQDLVWSEHSLRLYSRRGRILATVKPDAEWPDLWRVYLPDGHITDMVNLTRAKDAAVSLVLGALKGGESPAKAPPMRPFVQPLSVGLST